MKEHFKNLTVLLLICLILILLAQRSCSPDPDNGVNVQTEIVTTYDTINTVSTTYVPKYINKIEYRIDTVTTPIDTLAILQDYYSSYTYSDTVQVDSFGYIVVNDTISQNKIWGRSITQSLLIPTTTITNTIYENKREFYIGIEAGATIKGEINFVGTNLLFKTKKKQIYGIGVGLDRNFSPTFVGSMYWKLGKN